MLSRLANCFRLRGLTSLRQPPWCQADLSAASGCQERWSRGYRLGVGRFGCCSRVFLWAGATSAYCFVVSIRLFWLMWQDSREMHAFRAEAGKIFVPCIRFGVQSGDFGYIARESCRGVFVPRVLESCMGLRSCQRSVLRGPLRSSGQNKGPCRVGRGHVHADCPCSASASLDMKKAPSGAFFICYAICGVRRRQADFLRLIAARSQQKGAKGPVSRRLGEKSVEGHSLLAA